MVCCGCQLPRCRDGRNGQLPEHRAGLRMSAVGGAFGTRDEAAHGEYRTKRVILEIYDEMAWAMETGEPYRTRLDPPPADPRVGHPAKPAAAQ